MRPVILVLIGLALGGLLRSFRVAWAQVPASSAAVLTIAGSGSFSYYGNGPATRASFNGPNGLIISPDGAFLYFGDGREFSFSPASWRTSFMREENS